VLKPIPDYNLMGVATSVAYKLSSVIFHGKKFMAINPVPSL
jgi:hypothetical protein